MHKTLAIACAGFVAHVRAFWRMECPGVVGTVREDPVVYPGEDSPHIHSIHGSSGFSMTSTTADLLAGNCTSCRVLEDKSAYWYTSLYFLDASTGEFEMVNQTGGILAYYFLYDNPIAFPNNFRMVSGTTTSRNYSLGDPTQPDPGKSFWVELNQTSQSDLAQRAIGFNCMDYSKPPEPSLFRHYLPSFDWIKDNCPNNLRVEIAFPSCWKGGDAIDSPNHKDHVAFPNLVLTGDCPDDYPIKLPVLFYEIIFDIQAFKDRTGILTFSNGDPTGFGFHADFIMGWQEDFLQSVVETCTNDSGRIEDCSKFTIVDQSVATQCQLDQIPEALAKEPVYGPMSQLPGNVQITFADGSSTPGNTNSSSSSSSVAIPTAAIPPGEHGGDPSLPGPLVPGEAFKEISSVPIVAAISLPTTASDMQSTTTKPIATLAPVNELAVESVSFFTTQFFTDGNTVSEILWKQEVVTVTEFECVNCATATADVAAASATPAEAARFR